MKAFCFVVISCWVLFSACDLFKNEETLSRIPGKLVFSAPDNSEKQNYQIFTSNTDGSDLKQLTFFENDEAFTPVWSPNGSTIAFTTTLRGSSAGASLYLMNADGSGIRPLKEREGSPIVTPGSNPSWGPDGTKIAFDWCVNCELGGNNHEIFVYDFETDSILKITDNPANDNNPVWNPQKKTLAFLSNRNDSLTSNTALYIYEFTGTIFKITGTKSAGRPQWFSNGIEILFWSSNELLRYNTSDLSLSKIDMEISNYIGFRPLSISSNDKYVLLIGFSLTDNSENQKLSILELSSGKIVEQFEQTKFYGADWHYEKN